METPPIEFHPLHPFLPHNGQVLLLGSFPPQQKRWSIDFFYPNFQNDMWRIMGWIFYEDRFRFVDQANKRFRKDDIITFLNEKGIGLFDTAEAVRRLKDNASDNFLEIVHPTNVQRLLQQMPQCHTIATTGEKATQELITHYHGQKPSIGAHTTLHIEDKEIVLYRMPSTSRAYPLALEKKASYYHQMFADLGLI